MKLVLSIGFYEPWSGAWVTGTRKLWVKDRDDAYYTIEYYSGYFKETYGENAEVTPLKLKED